MNTQVMFYLLEQDNNEEKQYASLLHACFQAAYFYRQSKRVFIYTNDQQQAHLVEGSKAQACSEFRRMWGACIPRHGGIPCRQQYHT